ncbi:MAG: hypothetical protein QF371_07565, partial [Flavobacteriales bacterium]|nr:hypothetical protein [Flavobacteriales bacterium]
MNSVKTYALVAKLWSLVFLLVALLFLFVPDFVADFLNGLAQMVGLSGEIPAPSSTLWHVLTLSLMGTLTILASISSKNPTERSYYITIVAAKTISVIGFLWLMYQFGSAWIICAGADGFVALTLVLTFPNGISDMVPGFGRISKAKAPHYEVWYGKVDVSPGNAFWFRYTIINGKRQEA